MLVTFTFSLSWIFVWNLLKLLSCKYNWIFPQTTTNQKVFREVPRFLRKHALNEPNFEKIATIVQIKDKKS